MTKESEIEITESDKQLMSQVEIEAWFDYFTSLDIGYDPLELLEHNSGKKKIEIPKGTGPDDGDNL